VNESAREAGRPNINITPMIDVLLVLMIIFMVATTSRRHMPVQLPDPGAEGDGSNAIVLTVRAGGGYELNRQAVAPGTLGQRLHQIFDARNEKILYIDGSPEARYQEVMRGMDIAIGAGVTVMAAAPESARAR
jgi:biopolymer transport protein ExbD